MTRDELLFSICPMDRIFGCCNEYTKEYCNDCKQLMNKWLDEYDNHVIEQYKTYTNLKDTIREIHDNVAKEMYCKGVDDFAEAIKYPYDCGFNDKINNIAEQLKAGGKNEID